MNPAEMKSKSQALKEEAKSLAAEGKIELAGQKLDKATELLNKAQSLHLLNNKFGQYEAGLGSMLPEYRPGDDAIEDDEVKSALWKVRDQNYADDHVKLLKSVYGGEDPRQLALQQHIAFTQFLRGKAPTNILKRQYWSPRVVTEMLKAGMSPNAIKATMVEGTDILGGYAVPVEVGDRIITRASGLTSVRSGGATVVQTAGKSIEWLKVQGSGNKYVSGLRGSWGNETADPSETNWQYANQSIPVNIYTYKVPMSTSLLEDAVNIVDLFTRLVSDTLGIDEDAAFLTGSGNGQPHGILPNGTNARGLSKVYSGSTSGITMDAVKALKRGIASQYRLNARNSFIGNGDTGLELELMKDGNGQYFFESIESGSPFMGGVWRESGDMPDIATGAFPLLNVDLSAYIIVERLGLSIQRYNDSRTGINRVEYQVRRRIGGSLMEPYKASVMEIGTAP